MASKLRSEKAPSVMGPTCYLNYRIHQFWASLQTATITDRTLKLQGSTIFASQCRGSRLFIRQCYVDLWRLITADWKAKKARCCVLSTPGMGTSTFLAYVMYILKQQGATVLLSRSNESCRLFRSDGQVFSSSKLEHFSNAMEDPEVYVLVEGRFAMNVAAKVLQVRSVSADTDWIADLCLQSNITTRYMPSWSLEELQQCALACYPDEVEYVVERYKLYGGCVQHVLVKPDPRFIEEAFVRAKIMRIVMSDGKAGDTDCFLHWSVTGEAYDAYEWDFPSEDVRNKVIKLYRRELEAYFRQMAECSSNINFGQLRQRLYEIIMQTNIQELKVHMR